MSVDSLVCLPRLRVAGSASAIAFWLVITLLSGCTPSAKSSDAGPTTTTKVTSTTAASGATTTTSSTSVSPSTSVPVSTGVNGSLSGCLIRPADRMGPQHPDPRITAGRMPRKRLSRHQTRQLVRLCWRLGGALDRGSHPASGPTGDPGQFWFMSTGVLPCPYPSSHARRRRAHPRDACRAGRSHGRWSALQMVRVVGHLQFGHHARHSGHTFDAQVWWLAFGRYCLLRCRRASRGHRNPRQRSGRPARHRLRTDHDHDQPSHHAPHQRRRVPLTDSKHPL